MLARTQNSRIESNVYSNSKIQISMTHCADELVEFLAINHDSRLMAEVSATGEHHGQAMLVARVDYFLIAF